MHKDVNMSEVFLCDRSRLISNGDELLSVTSRIIKTPL